MLSESEIWDLLVQRLPKENLPKRLNIITDTSDYYKIGYDDIVLLNNIPYLIRHDQKEGRFGIDEQPKFWVKKAIDLIDASQKIIKLTFHERFTSRVGDITFECFRSSKKEARILEMVRGDRRFMQGFSVKDSAGNIVRIIDFIKGINYADYILTLGSSHEDYFFNYFPQVLDEYIELVKAIAFLHENNEKHGDIRRDHIIREKNTCINTWIDFDYNYIHKENMFGYDLFGLGNILTYITGRGDVTIQALKATNSPAFYTLNKDDMNIIFNNRVVNLKKVFEYIPDELNLILLHFSVGAPVYYDDTRQLLTDLQELRQKISK
ncbi:MAG: hypothetical protein N3A62_06605 [Thermodesulfovibrionales bacterium]|nr:hypothetical protein [Thermodesulfovibrionales bacterium]